MDKFLYSEEVQIGISPERVGIEFANGNSGQQAAVLDAAAGTWGQWKPSARDSQIDFLVSGLSERAMKMVEDIAEFVALRRKARKEAGIE